MLVVDHREKAIAPLRVPARHRRLDLATDGDRRLVGLEAQRPERTIGASVASLTTSVRLMNPARSQ